MALIPIGPWKRDSTYYRGHPLGLMDSTYRIPLLDFLGYVTHGTTAFKVLQDLVVPSLRSGCHSQSFWTLNAVEPRATYPNLYLEYNEVF